MSHSQTNVTPTLISCHCIPAVCHRSYFNVYSIVLRINVIRFHIFNFSSGRSPTMTQLDLVVLLQVGRGRVQSGSVIVTAAYRSIQLSYSRAVQGVIQVKTRVLPEGTGGVKDKFEVGWCQTRSQQVVVCSLLMPSDVTQKLPCDSIDTTTLIS